VAAAAPDLDLPPDFAGDGMLAYCLAYLILLNTLEPLLMIFCQNEKKRSNIRGRALKNPASISSKK
jgi:hypothetical protein